MRTMNNLLRPLSLLLLGTLGFACDAPDDGDDMVDAELRHIYFDAAEINETLASDPDTVFVVDLSEGNIVHFDQSEEAFDFGAFMAQCPSMPAPVPMLTVIDELELELEDMDVWTMQSALTESIEFRAVADGGGGGCYLRCNSNGTDCVEICN